MAPRNVPVPVTPVAETSGRHSRSIWFVSALARPPNPVTAAFVGHVFVRVGPLAGPAVPRFAGEPDHLPVVLTATHRARTCMRSGFARATMPASTSPLAHARLKLVPAPPPIAGVKSTLGLPLMLIFTML